MLIPGFEGHHQIFTRVCERLKVQAMTFQLGPDMTEDSIQKMASNIMKVMFKEKNVVYSKIVNLKKSRFTLALDQPKLL